MNIELYKKDIAVFGVKQQGKSYFVKNRMLPIIQTSGYNYVIIDTKNDARENLSEGCDYTTKEAMGVWQGMNKRGNVHFSVTGSVKEKAAKIDAMYERVMQTGNYIFYHDEAQPVKGLLKDDKSNMLRVYTESGSRCINFIICAQKLTAQIPTIVRDNSLVFVYFFQPQNVVKMYWRYYPNLDKAANLGQYECIVTDATGNGFKMDRYGKVVETYQANQKMEAVENVKELERGEQGTGRNDTGNNEVH